MDIFGQHRFRLGAFVALAALSIFAAAWSANVRAAQNAWVPGGAMAVGRSHHTSTLLPSGLVLVAGGQTSAFTPTVTVELYDPATNRWRQVAPLATARYEHTATLLPSGKVLVAGGMGGGAHYLDTAEIYDPRTETWSAAASLAKARQQHTATLLPSGKVLIAGGDAGINGAVNAELYDPASDTWSAAGRPATYRTWHTAVLLPSGRVLIAGGYGLSTARYVSTSELYDPATNSWSAAASLSTARGNHTATLLPSGRVLVAGGFTNGSNPCSGCILGSAESYDPATDTWSGVASMAMPRMWHTASLLPSGKVLVVAGSQAPGNGELYDPASDSWSSAGALTASRSFQTATLLASGRLLVAGGSSNGSFLSGAELYDGAVESWNSTGNLNGARFAHTSTLLPSGQVIIAGGFSGGALSTTERYDASANMWSVGASLATPRASHTATLLPTGKVLAVGGLGTGSVVLGSAELYDADTDRWSAAGSLATIRHSHTATLLPSGTVLITGGYNFGANSLASSERYDPSTNSWGIAATLSTARYEHTATLLPSGKVLVVGGNTNGVATALCEVYDPAANAWQPAASLASARYLHTATLLPSGKVLVAGGRPDSAGTLSSAELYDPATDTWSSAGTMTTPRFYHTAALLHSGRILVAGGRTANAYLASAETYDPVTNAWSAAGNFTSAQSRRATTLLADGRALFSGGGINGGGSSVSETYSADIGVADGRRASITAVDGSLGAAQSLQISGSRFNGDSEAAGGGTRGSPTHSPLLQLRRLDNDQLVWASPAADSVRSDTTYRSDPITGLPLGYYALTMFVNGIPSASRIIKNAPAHLVTSNAGPHGSISPDGPQLVTEGSTVVFAVTSSQGYHVAAVTGCGGSLSGDTYTTAAVMADCSITASFAIDTYTVTATAGANGSITPSMQTVDYGSTASFIVAPAQGYHVVAVTGCGGSLSGDTYTTAAVMADCSVTASFAIDTYTVTATAGANGSITPPMQTVDYGSTASFIVAPAQGHHVAAVTGCGGSLSGDTYTTAAVMADCSVTASFAIDTYTVTATAGANGSITPPMQTVDYGSTANFIVEPMVGFHVASVGGTCGGNLTGPTYITDIVVADCSVIATFTADTAVSLAITIDDRRAEAAYGTTLDYTVTVTNEGDLDASGVSLANTLPPQLDATNTHWVCLGGDSGVHCTASGDGSLQDGDIAVPAGAHVSWLISSPVLPDAMGLVVENAVEVTDGVSTSTATDTDVLVILRDGFDSVDVPAQVVTGTQ